MRINWNRDLKSAKWIYLKGALFAVILVVSSLLLYLLNPHWLTVVLTVLVIWASARLYYFFFYVIEKYTDPGFKFAGVISAIRHILRSRRR